MSIATEVQVVPNGLQALEYIKGKIASSLTCPELILLDIKMPVMDGFEFLKHFSKLELKNKLQIVLILLTTSTHSKDLEKVKQYNVHGILNKPLTEEKLMAILNKVSPSTTNN